MRFLYNCKFKTLNSLDSHFNGMISKCHILGALESEFTLATSPELGFELGCGLATC